MRLGGGWKWPRDIKEFSKYKLGEKNKKGGEKKEKRKKRNVNKTWKVYVEYGRFLEGGKTGNLDRPCMHISHDLRAGCILFYASIRRPSIKA